jgi:hypothetical protein
MKRIFGVILILVALVVGYDVFKAWQNMETLELLASITGDTPKQDAIFQSILTVVIFAFGVALVDD